MDFFTEGVSTAAVVTLDTDGDEGRENTTESVTRFPAGLCCRDGTLRYYGRLEHDFPALFRCLLLIYVIFSLSLSYCVWLLRVPSSLQKKSHLLLSSK